MLKLLSLHCLSQQSSWLSTQQSEQVTSCHTTNHSKQLITSPMSLPRSTLVLVGCVFTNTHVITHHNNVTQSCTSLVGYYPIGQINRIPFSTSIQPSMSHLSHITLSLPIPLPFPQLVTCPQHPKPGHGSPNFCRHPLIFLLLSVVEIPGVIRSLVAEHLIVRNWALFERGFSARSHLFRTKRISWL